jgi:predicted metal-dependent peptidase
MKALEILKRAIHILDASGSEMFTEDEIDLAITELEKLQSILDELNKFKTCQET